MSDDWPSVDEISCASTPGQLLPVRPRPVEREAAIGYLIRVAAANGYETPRQLWAALQIHRQKDILDALCERINLSHDDVICLFGMYPSYWRVPIQHTGLVSADFNHILMRWCPLCLSTSLHLHGVWGLKLYCACTRHAVLLCERCPQCKQVQYLERVDIGRCHCGARLNFSPTLAASKALLLVNKAIESSAFGGCVTTDFPMLGAAAWQRLIRYLGQFAENSQPARPGQIVGLHKLDIAIYITSAAGNLLDYWPDNFHALLTVIHRRESNTPSVRRTFGTLYRVLYFHLHEPCYQFLRDAFEDYLHLNWWGIICKRNRSFKANTVVAHPQLTLKQAAIKAGTDQSIVRHLIQAELITGSEAALPSGRKAQSIHQDSVASIVAITKDSVNLAEAARLLVLSKKRARELVDGGIITPLISRPQANAASWLIPMLQLQKLSFQSIAMGSDISPVTLKWILHFWRLQKGEFVALALALLNNDIVPVAKQIQTTVIGELLFDVRQVHKWLSSRRIEFDSSMSVDLASKMLGLKQQVTYELVRNGILNSTDCDSHGKRVSQKDLQDFQKAYVSLAEVARLRGHSPKKILNEIAAPPICGPSVDGTRQYFYRRSDIDAEKLSSITYSRRSSGPIIYPNTT